MNSLNLSMPLISISIDTVRYDKTGRREKYRRANDPNLLGTRFIFSSPTPTHQPACLLILKEALGLLNVIFFIDFEWLASIHIFRGIPPLKNIRILSGFGPQKVCWVLETPSHGFLWYFDNPSTTLHLIPYLYNKMCIIIYFLPISSHKMGEAKTLFSPFLCYPVALYFWLILYFPPLILWPSTFVYLYIAVFLSPPVM